MELLGLLGQFLGLVYFLSENVCFYTRNSVLREKSIKKCESSNKIILMQIYGFLKEFIDF